MFSWKNLRQDRFIERFISEQSIRGIFVLEEPTWEYELVSVAVGDKMPAGLPDGPWAVVVGLSCCAAYYALACRALNLLAGGCRKVLSISSSPVNTPLIESLADYGAQILYRSGVHEQATADVLGQVYKWRLVSPLGQPRPEDPWQGIFIEEVFDDCLAGGCVFPDIGEDGELGIASSMMSEFAGPLDLLPRNRHHKVDLHDACARLLCSGTSALPPTTQSFPRHPVFGPLRTAAAKDALTALDELADRYGQWLAATSSNGLVLDNTFFADGKVERFENIASLLGIGEMAQPAKAGQLLPLQEPSRSTRSGRISDESAPSHRVFAALDKLTGSSPVQVFAAKDGYVESARHLDMFSGAGSSARAAIAFVPEDMVFDGWLDIAVALGFGKGIEWWYSVKVPSYATWRFECPERCEVVLDLAGVSAGEDLLSGLYDIQKRHPRSLSAHHAPNSYRRPFEFVFLDGGFEPDEEQRRILEYGQLLLLAEELADEDLVIRRETVTMADDFRMASLLAPLLTFHKKEFPLDAPPHDIDATRLRAARNVAKLNRMDPLSETISEVTLIRQAATIWRNILPQGQHIDLQALPQKEGAILAYARALGVESAVEALYSGVALEDLLA